MRLTRKVKQFFNLDIQRLCDGIHRNGGGHVDVLASLLIMLQGADANPGTLGQLALCDAFLFSYRFQLRFVFGHGVRTPFLSIIPLEGYGVENFLHIYRSTTVLSEQTTLVAGTRSFQ